MESGVIGETLAGWIAGPTAVGKSEVALIVAQRQGWSILSVDSRQIYRRLELGTAKPTPDERARVPHLLLDLLEPDEPASAGIFRELAFHALAELRGHGRRALAVGGAGLYFEALTRGLHPLPRASASIRARHEEILRQEGSQGLHARLAAVDPATAARLAPGDRQRISRALEVYELSGRPLSEHLAGPRPRSWDGPVIALHRSRADLADRIERRCAAMLEAGLLAEAAALLASGLAPDAPGLRTVGYREFLPHLLSGVSLDRCREAFVRNTRAYARRQETWLRGRVPGRIDLEIGAGEAPEETAGRVARVLALRDGPNPA